MQGNVYTTRFQVFSWHYVYCKLPTSKIVLHYVFKWLYQPSCISIWYECVPFKSYSRTCWSFLTWTPDVLTLILDEWCQYLKIYANKSRECTLYKFVLCILLWFKEAACEFQSPLLTVRWIAIAITCVTNHTFSGKNCICPMISLYMCLYVEVSEIWWFTKLASVVQRKNSFLKEIFKLIRRTSGQF